MLSAKELGDLEFMRELLGYFGPRRMAWLLGWCSVLMFAGVQTRTDLLGTSVCSVPTRYRLLKELRAFRDHLRAKGYEFGEEDEQAVGALVIRLAELGRAA
jgi:hypothetical protein